MTPPARVSRLQSNFAGRAGPSRGGAGNPPQLLTPLKNNEAFIAVRRALTPAKGQRIVRCQGSWLTCSNHESPKDWIIG